jgi:hypothetical protein
VYCIPFECGKVYVGQTSRTTEIRCQEHIRHPHHGQPEHSTVTEFLLNTRHEIQFEKHTEQKNYLQGLDGEKKLEIITTSQKLQQRGWLHIKPYMAAVN